MIVGSGMGLGIDDHRRLFRRRVERGFDRLGLGRGRQLPKPLATTTKAIPAEDDPSFFSAQAGHPVNLIERHEVRQQQRHASVTTYPSCRAAGLVGNDLAIDGRAPRDGMSNPSTRRVAQKIRGQSFPSLTERSLAGFLLARPGNG